jgi:hypothetical protein
MEAKHYFWHFLGHPQLDWLLFHDLVLSKPSSGLCRLLEMCNSLVGWPCNYLLWLHWYSANSVMQRPGNQVLRNLHVLQCSWRQANHTGRNLGLEGPVALVVGLVDQVDQVVLQVAQEKVLMVVAVVHLVAWTMCGALITVSFILHPIISSFVLCTLLDRVG